MGDHHHMKAVGQERPIFPQLLCSDLYACSAELQPSGLHGIIASCVGKPTGEIEAYEKDLGWNFTWFESEGVFLSDLPWIKEKEEGIAGDVRRVVSLTAPLERYPNLRLLAITTTSEGVTRMISDSIFSSLGNVATLKRVIFPFAEDFTKSLESEEISRHILDIYFKFTEPSVPKGAHLFFERPPAKPLVEIATSQRKFGSIVTVKASIRDIPISVQSSGAITFCSVYVDLYYLPQLFLQIFEFFGGVTP